MGRLTKVLESIGYPRVLVIGDIILDRYVWGDVDRISPEAPISVLDVQREESRPGGAGNAAYNLAALQAHVFLAGIVGEDGEADETRTLLAELGVDSSLIFSDPSRPTTVKTRMIAQNQQVLRVDHEVRLPLSPETAKRLNDSVLARMREFDVVLLSDYKKGTLSETFTQSIIRSGREQGIPVLVDPKGRDFSIYRGAYLLTPNRLEAEIASGRSLGDDCDLEAMGGKMCEDLELDALVVTLSKDGISLFQKGAPWQKFGALPRAVFDVSGAGDTVLSILGLAVASGVALSNAVELANIAGGIVVGKVGVVPITRDELKAELMTPAEKTPSKILGLEKLKGQLSEKRSRGARVVFTNGCYDLLHAGHISLLQFSQNQGDLLVVGLNSDRSVRRLKGPERPIVGEEDRARLLAALAVVDYVVLFDEDTPIELIQTLSPDVLVKGEDWQGKGVVGQEHVESYGGQVVFCPMMGGLSTSAIVERIRNRFSAISTAPPREEE
ncbi:MAG: D-glycero-beta-D-manno-heptose-7-phosphate kinase [Planctomycetota bacterium]|nr:D-glycero-beta-D-manno-heptose-7-phosphate kinase [Planctomycetota bacterium]